MAEFKEIMAIRNRMCNKLKSCANCQIYSGNTGTTCRELAHKDPERYEDILLKWDAGNPIKTNAVKFKETFNIDVMLTGCDGFVCPDNRLCETCEFQNFWEQEYKEDSNGRND